MGQEEPKGEFSETRSLSVRRSCLTVQQDLSFLISKILGFWQD
ncbi:unnamed protein product [Haemonchus placei]|uniref:Uncharacterized protein n=1 Tax=Haemonchus placei TaxID=6290 RepID=A0A0N4VXB4_HAEPC|nr:unnamed protein product [Haemonchus placei]